MQPFGGHPDGVTTLMLGGRVDNVVDLAKAIMASGSDHMNQKHSLVCRTIKGQLEDPPDDETEEGYLDWWATQIEHHADRRRPLLLYPPRNRDDDDGDAHFRDYWFTGIIRYVEDTPPLVARLLIPWWMCYESGDIEYGCCRWFGDTELAYPENGAGTGMFNMRGEPIIVIEERMNPDMLAYSHRMFLAYAQLATPVPGLTMPSTINQQSMLSLLPTGAAAS